MQTTTTPQTSAPAKVKAGWVENVSLQVWKQLPATKKKSTVADMLRAYQADLHRALPKFMPAERYLNTLMTAITRKPELLECEPFSLLRTWMHSASLGLDPDTPQQHSHTVAFFNGKKGIKEAQLIVGYRGMIELAYRSEKVASIEARVVYEGDNFAYSFGDAPYIDHKPSSNIDPKRKVVAAYAVIRMKGSENWPMREVMLVDEIEQIRAMSKGANSFGWTDHYPEMCKKTVLRRALKLIPNSRELARAIQLEDAADTDEGQPDWKDFTDAIITDAEHPTEPTTTKSDKVAEKLKQKSEGQPATPVSLKDQVVAKAQAVGLTPSQFNGFLDTEYGVGIDAMSEDQLKSALEGLDSFAKK